MPLLNAEIKDAKAIVLADPANGLCQIGEKKTDALRLILAVVEPKENEGETIEWMGWLSDNAFENTDKRLREVFGFDGDYEALAANPNLFAQSLCRITTEFETYNGKERLKVKWLNNAESANTATPLPPAEAKGLASRLKARSMALAKAAGTSTTTTTAKRPNTPQPGDSDEIPY